MELDEFKKKIKLKNENLFIVIDDKETSSKLKFSVSNELTLWRAQTLFTKEPVTIEWIRNFKKKSIFFDIGANIGVYSIFAAIISKATVYSFEPESNNFQSLMENIILNNLISNINPYPIGISNQTTITSLYLDSFIKGNSHHSVGESMDHNLQIKKTKIKQGIFSTTLEDLIKSWNFPVPNYLKIDVDGIEYKIIERSHKLLENKNLESVLIEINPKREKDKEIIKTLLYYDFIFDKTQVRSATRKDGPHRGYAEYLFYRK